MARTQGQRRLVHAVSAGAQAAGLAPGQTVALAQASVPGLAIVDADLDADAAALARLAVWALRYTPMVAPDGSPGEQDGLVLETTGADHLHGGEAALLSDLLSRLRGSGLSARGAFSSSRLLSRGLARFGTEERGQVVPPGAEEEAAADLPVAALGIGDDAVASLRKLGLGLVGPLSRTPRASLARRFGPELTAALDRIHARTTETLDPIEPEELIFARLGLAEPIAHQAGVEGALARLTDDLCARLERRGLGARVLDLRCGRVDGETQVLRARAAAPSRDPAHMRRLFGEGLDTIDPGFGIERLVLVAARTASLTPAQRTTEEEAAPPLALLIDKLGARVGRGRVFRAAPTESDVPERCFRRAGPLGGAARTTWDRLPRPAILLRPPEPIDVLALLPDHPPKRFVWRGRPHRTTRADGPECVFGEWWHADDEAALTRDYYRVETEEGGRYWLFRARDEAAGTADWFVHGVFG